MTSKSNSVCLYSPDVPASETFLETYPDWRGYLVKGGLSPGSAYHFRVTSCNNDVGCSPASGGPYGEGCEEREEESGKSGREKERERERER